MATLKTITHTLSSAVSAGGSFSIPFPDGTSGDDYAGGDDGRLYTASRNPVSQKAGHYSLSFDASNIIVTLASNVALANGETVYLDIDVGGASRGGGELNPASDVAKPSAMSVMTPVKISLGKPAASDSDGAVASQNCTAAGGLATGINGALASNGVATFDVPRNVVAAWTNTAVLTVTGTDEYGNTITESSGSGTSMTGKKAFKTVTGISVSADVTGLTVGTSKVLGLPVFVADVVDVIAEMQDNAAATAGTVVAGVTLEATATTGDVRGTYAPNGTPNGSLSWTLIALVRDPQSKGVPQYAA